MIIEILNELAATSSRLEKEAILKREKDNELLKRVIVAAYDPYVTYGIKQIPEFVGKIDRSNKTLDTSLRDSISELMKLAKRQATGNAAIELLKNILEMSSKENAEVIIRIIERDLKCGINESTINKIWTGLIPTFDVMLAHKDTSGIKYPAYAQTKMDGARGHLVWNGYKATLWSRQGKPFQILNTFDEACKTMFANEKVTIDGELLFVDENGKLLDRKASNGLANKANKGTISDEELSRAVFVAWDIVDYTSTIPYKVRLANLSTNFGALAKSANIWMVDTKLVNTEQEAWEFYEEQIAHGHEGAVIKNIQSVWVPKRSKDLGKMKAEEEADLRVVGFNWGTGKFTGKMGSLICRTEDGLLEVNVSGFVDADREKTDEWVGKIVTVKYNQIIQDKKTGGYSLFLPRYVETRFDKTVANTLGELK